MTTFPTAPTADFFHRKFSAGDKLAQAVLTETRFVGAPFAFGESVGASCVDFETGGKLDAEASRAARKELIEWIHQYLADTTDGLVIVESELANPNAEPRIKTVPFFTNSPSSHHIWTGSWNRHREPGKSVYAFANHMDSSLATISRLLDKARGYPSILILTHGRIQPHQEIADQDLATLAKGSSFVGTGVFDEETYVLCAVAPAG